MSSSSSSSPPSSEDDLRNQRIILKTSLECPHCVRTFTPPVSTLPCLHSFCSSCLKDCPSFSSPSLFRCPVCDRSAADGEKETMSTTVVKENEFIASQLERLASLEAFIKRTETMSFQVEEKCSFCKAPSQEEAVSHCPTCRKHLCERHEEFHAEIHPDHPVLSMGELEESLLVSPSFLLLFILFIRGSFFVGLSFTSLGKSGDDLHGL